MNMVQALLSHGLVLASTVLLLSCSGATVEEQNAPPTETGAAAKSTSETDAKAVEAAMTKETGAQGGSQDPQDVANQRRKFIIEQSLVEARRSLDLKLWNDAARAAAQVLEIEPSNAEARQILLAAQDLLGQGGKSATAQFQDKVVQRQVAIAQDEFKVRQELAMGDALMEQRRYDDAIESYRRAGLVLRYSIYYEPGQNLEKQVEGKLAQARDAKQQAEQAQAEQRRMTSQRELEEQERKQRIARESRVKRLLEQANYDFQTGRYDSSVQLLDQALQLDPTNGYATSLRDLASRARHENRMDLLRQDWKREWSKTFDELNAADIPQSEVMKFDLARWTEVSDRKPLEFSAAEQLETPEERAILEKLRSTRLEHRFAKASVEDWASYYAKVTEVNFMVTQPVKELDPATTSLTDLALPPMSVAQALDVIGQQTGVRWRIANGVVQLVTPDKAMGKTYLQVYEVRDLVQGVKDRPGRDLKLTAPGEEQPAVPGDEEEAKPTVVDAQKLIDLVRNTIEPTSWEGGEASISEQKGGLLIRQTKEVHASIAKLLADLRAAVNLQVNVEARFLRVEDSFLEDIGVDFRGLGNQASEGIPGRGLEQNNRSNAGFDDFGQRQNTNPAAPGQIGTGTEPGVFFDDGGDGDLMARTENLFDRTLGSRENGLDNAGGLALQWAYLDDTELEAVLRAVAKRQRSQEITAPRLLVFNNTRASMNVLRHTSYIKDFDVEIAQAAAVANPVVDVVRDGVVLDVRPVVSSDRQFITMELRPTVMTLQLPIPTFTTTLGVGQPISIQLPRVTRQSVRTTVTMPDGGTILLGGMNLSEKQNMVSGIPLLMDIPIVNFLFSRKGTSISNMKILILLRANIVISSELEPAPVREDISTLMGLGGR
ncbi:MAG: hypothetical protein IT458_06135 [Planctomycetes bacterium]|nr:hypothetical protein [Planctomycetota bacterium]